MTTAYRTRRSKGGYVGALTIVHSDAAALQRAREALEQAVEIVGIPRHWEEVEHPAAGGAFILVGRRKVQSISVLPTVEEIIEAIRAAARPRRSTE